MMLSTLNPSLDNSTSGLKTPLILCYYTNISSKLQILCIDNIATKEPKELSQSSQSLEENFPLTPEITKLDITTQGLCQKVIFPGQRILFQAFPESILKIYLGGSKGEKFIDQIQCHHLRVSQGNAY